MVIKGFKGVGGQTEMIQNATKSQHSQQLKYITSYSITTSSNKLSIALGV